MSGVEQHQLVLAFRPCRFCDRYLRRGVLGDSLSALRDGMLGELTREDKAHRRLDLTRGQGRLGVVLAKLASFGGKALENVHDERVHDAHGLLADASVRVNLLEHLVHVRAEGFRALLALLLLAIGRGLCRLLGRLLAGLFGHFGDVN
jgi:hypothetical protein